MVAEEASVAGILGAEHGHLPPEEGGEEHGAVAQQVRAEPQAGH